MRAMIPTAGTVVLGDVAEPAPAIDEAVVAVEAYSVNRGETFLLEAPPGQPGSARLDGAGQPTSPYARLLRLGRRDECDDAQFLVHR